MLFKKCQKPYRTTKDIAKPSSYDTASDKDLWTPADSSQSTFRYTYDSPKGSQLTSSFTSSSKIVNLLSLSLSRFYIKSSLTNIIVSNITTTSTNLSFSFVSFSFPPFFPPFQVQIRHVTRLRVLGRGGGGVAAAVPLPTVHRGRGGGRGGEGRHRVHTDDHQAGGASVQGGDRESSAGRGFPNFSNPLAPAHPGTGVRILFR